MSKKLIYKCEKVLVEHPKVSEAIIGEEDER